METPNNLQTLDQISLATICSYLTPFDVMLNLSLTCKDFHKSIAASPYIIKSFFENLLGRKIFEEYKFNLTFAKLQKTLKDRKVAKALRPPLPFFGYRSNSGCLDNNYNNLFDKIFECRENKSIIRTEAGENFHIEGALSKGYGRETRNLQNFLSGLDKEIVGNFKEWLEEKGMECLEYLCSSEEDPLSKRAKPLKQFREELANYLKEKNEKYNIELKCQKMAKSLGLIQSCSLSRDVGKAKYPVKTLMAFASLNEEIGSSPLVALFNPLTAKNKFS